MKYLFYALRFIWELPQNLLGLIIYILNKNKIINVKTINGRFLFENKRFGISLGSFVFWMPSSDDVLFKVPQNLSHEYGHSFQSLMFGPLYLIVIGFPSVLRVLFAYVYYYVKRKHWQNYYSGFPEKWADNLGAKKLNRYS